MSGYSELARLGVQVRPIDVWPGVATPADERDPAPFRAQMTSTIEILATELEAIDAERVVIQLDVTPSDLRIDGLPRANAKIRQPGVIVSFDSRYGPLRYAADRFDATTVWRPRDKGGTFRIEGWQANLRAIALGLHDLRRVDRYGISKRGEQYRGYAELPSGIAQPATHMTSDDARAVIAEWARVETDLVDVDGDHLASQVRAAMANAHPDRNGGESDAFHRVVAARDLLARKADA